MVGIDPVKTAEMIQVLCCLKSPATIEMLITLNKQKKGITPADIMV